MFIKAILFLINWELLYFLSKPVPVCLHHSATGESSVSNNWTTFNSFNYIHPLEEKRMKHGHPVKQYVVFLFFKNERNEEELFTLSQLIFF